MGWAGGWGEVRGRMGWAAQGWGVVWGERGGGEHAHFAPTPLWSSLSQVNYASKARARFPISTSQVASQGT